MCRGPAEMAVPSPSRCRIAPVSVDRVALRPIDEAGVKDELARLQTAKVVFPVRVARGDAEKIIVLLRLIYDDRVNWMAGKMAEKLPGRLDVP